MLINHSYINNHSKFILQAKNSNEKKPAVFFDRDGVLIHDCDYISDPNNVVLEKGAKEILSFFRNKDWLIFVITNQSGISRKYFTWDDYKLITEKFLSLIGNSFLINAIYANGFINEDDSNWRKPNPGMIIEASNDFNIDLENSILVGDRLSDIKAGIRAGLNNVFHVLTGHGMKERDLILKDYLSNVHLKNKNFNKVRFKEKDKSCNLFLINNLLDIKNFLN